MKKVIILFLLINTFYSIEYNFIKYEEEDSIAILTINRPKALNALNSQVLDELNNSLDNINLSKIKSLIITGAGEKSFVAGADISEMSTLTKKEAEAFGKKGNDIFRKIETFQIPVIAAVNGFALGGGCEISMSCDIRICSDNAIFGQPEVGLGITPGFGGTQRLPRLIGASMAKQIIFTGQNIKAEEALRIGLVNAIYPQNELLNEAKKLAKEISKNSVYAIKNSKKAVNEGLQVDIDEGIKIEEKYFGDCFETPDQKTRMENFLNKGKSKKENKKDEKKDNKPSEKNKEEENKELKKTDIFTDMIYLKSFTTPQMPAILSVGTKDNHNSMAIGWGSLGSAWKRPIFTVYVKPETYTYEFMEKYDIFTVSFVKGSIYNDFVLYGSVSGRDFDKEKISGTHIKFLEDGGITFEEALEVYVCKKIAVSHLKEEEVDKSIIDLYNSNLPVYSSTKPHTVYIGEIIGHYVK
jgi:enoyl-CoA hydratase